MVYDSKLLKTQTDVTNMSQVNHSHKHQNSNFLLDFEIQLLTPVDVFFALIKTRFMVDKRCFLLVAPSFSNVKAFIKYLIV